MGNPPMAKDYQTVLQTDGHGYLQVSRCAVTSGSFYSIENANRFSLRFPHLPICLPSVELRTLSSGIHCWCDCGRRWPPKILSFATPFPKEWFSRVCAVCDLICHFVSPETASYPLEDYEWYSLDSDENLIGLKRQKRKKNITVKT